MVDLNGYWGPWAASVSKGRKCLEAYNISLDRNKKTNRREQVKMILVCCLLQSHRGLLLPFAVFGCRRVWLREEAFSAKIPCSLLACSR
jgi:hypothetical protein